MREDALIHSAVMRRITRIYYLRRVTSPTAMLVYMEIALAVCTFSLVSVSNIINNIQTIPRFFDVFTFFTNALLHTEGLVQLVLGIGVLLGFFLMRDIIRMMRSPQNAKILTFAK